MIPVASTYPTTIDTDQNLYQVNDSLRVVLAEDYNPGDKSIFIIGDPQTIFNFPQTGLITLTEQCSDPEVRAISFYYGSRTTTSFNELEILPNFVDVAKPKTVTNVTQNVMAVHHNAQKDALIAIEKFAGKKGEIAIRPLEGTMEERINYIRNIALTPKAWFNVDNTIGLAPLTVTFQNQSFRTGGDGTSINVEYLWDFGDNSGPSIVTIEETTEVPTNTTNVLVNDTDGGTIIKTYTKPGIYTASLKVTNDFGTDTVIFTDLITARFSAPDEAVINFIQRAGQIVTAGDPVNGPYTTLPTIRSTTNSIIDVIINPGINPSTGKTYSGEIVDGTNTPIDPIKNYTWSFSDDIPHTNAQNARAVFSIGGIYDLNLRVDTSFGSYRITNYQNVFDIVENINLWLWVYNTNGSVSASEFGLYSETFKQPSQTTLNLNRDDSFLTSQPNQIQQKREFKRNNGFIQRGSNLSGNGGVGLLYWASGRSAVDSATAEKIKMSEFNGFVGTYTSRPDHARPWNWVSFGSSTILYFILGGTTSANAPNASLTNQKKDILALNNLAYSSQYLSQSNYKNGAEELMLNEVTYDNSGNSQQGDMSVYRSAWYQEAGYFLRNEGVGQFFRIKSFYKTSGNSSDLFIDIRKLPDMAGSARLEGQLVPLSQGVYFFNNSGAVAAYSSTSGTWATGGPGVNSASFRLLQDTSVVGFDSNANSLLAASDGSSVAYLSYDYSPKAFIKFNESDTTFSSITARPDADQWQMTVF